MIFLIKKMIDRVLPSANHILMPAVSSSPSAFTHRKFSQVTASLHLRSDRSVRKYSALVNSAEQETVIALGSNVGNRLDNFNTALKLMKESGISITHHACLYESAPAYVTDQPLFLNSAVRAKTKLGPHELLTQLKQIEKILGRSDGIRYGPRPLDLDILFYGNFSVQSETLTVPHERIHERPFVLAPLLDLLGSSLSNDIEASWNLLSGCSGGIDELWKNLGGHSLIGKEGLRRVLPVGDRLIDFSERTYVMGILNLTPDSFSDGGKFEDVNAAVAQVKLMVSQGADIIDVGAQSTRPFARLLSADEELQRLIPILEAVSELPEVEGKLLSVDTFYAEVAAEAVKRGVHVVNDVSGGRLDPGMLSVVAELGTPYIVMHMRGDPSTMQTDENLLYKNVCKEVACELYARVHDAELSGVPLWRMIIDPGIGFSKSSEHNLEILSSLPSIREELRRWSIGASHVPILIGPSRKRFLGDVCGRADPTERDAATVAASTASLLGGANMLRVHNVDFGRDAARVSDALLRHRKGQK